MMREAAGEPADVSPDFTFKSMFQMSRFGIFGCSKFAHSVGKFRFSRFSPLAEIKFETTDTKVP